jgi:hypothetical protein
VPRQSLLIVTVLTLAATGAMLPRIARVHARTGRVALARTAVARNASRGDALLQSDAAWRWRQGDPAHWRSCLLQH